MTWAGERSKHFCSFQSPEMFFLLTLPFIERRYGDSPSNQSVRRTEKPSPGMNLARDGPQPNALSCLLFQMPFYNAFIGT